MARDDTESPLVQALTSGGNIFLLVLSTIFLVDLLLGSPVTLRIVLMIGRVQGHDPQGAGVRILTPLGTYTDPRTLARVYDYVLIGVGYVVAGFSLFLGILSQLRQPRD